MIDRCAFCEEDIQENQPCITSAEGLFCDDDCLLEFALEAFNCHYGTFEVVA